MKKRIWANNKFNFRWRKIGHKKNQSTIEVKNDININSSKAEPFKEQKSNFIPLKEETSNNIFETYQTILNEMGILNKSIH